MDNNRKPDNRKPPTPTIWNQKYFKVLIISNIIFIISLIIFMPSGTLFFMSSELSIPNEYTNFALITSFLSTIPTILFGAITTISALYTFFKTIKKKDTISHAHNIFSRYIIAAYLISAIYLFIVYKIFNLYLYLKISNLEMTNILPFLLINIAGFVHLIILNNKYQNYQQSPPNNML